MINEFFKWNDIYSTGITKIDIQHKVIIKILNELYSIVIIDKDSYKIDDILNELINYTVYHFGEEEKLFEKYGFNLKESHIKEHRDFEKEVTCMVANGGKKNNETFVINLINFLKEWLTEHILVTDQKYVEYFNKNNISI